MFGYVMPLKSELKIREFEVYTAFYCAICHAVRKRYGQLPRLLLSYDAVFLALLATSIESGLRQRGAEPEGGAPAFKEFRCFVSPGKRRNEALASPQIDYAADMLVLLAYQNLKDDKQDDGGFLNGAGETLLRGAGKKAAKRYPEKAERIAACLAEIAALEKENCGQIDRIADPFGRIMAEVTEFPPVLLGEEALSADSAIPATLRTIGYHLGRFVYIMDAVDDRERDRAKNQYNPLLVGAGFEAEGITLQQTRAFQPVKGALDATLQLDLAQVSNGMHTLPLGHFRPILENIIFLGLNAVKDDVMAQKKGRKPRDRYLRP
ncbi:MAG: DUF5685 family protein [Clostridiales Family XIII bacterium]|jgi:hypothetical protein|nr:DUF5685 family protein [Clostridiales Family XIII bacterium]